MNTQTLYNAVTLGGNMTIGAGSGSGDLRLVFAGPITLGQSVTLTPNFHSTSYGVDFNGNITDGSVGGTNYDITVASGTGYMYLSGTNTYRNTIINPSTTLTVGDGGADRHARQRYRRE